MSENIVEYTRKQAIQNLFKAKKFSNSWDIWSTTISTLIPSRTGRELFNIGDYLKDIFNKTNTDTRSQSTVSAGGSCWEALVCWYLNICLIGSRTIVIKHNKNLIPTCISNAITINYGTYPSNTEADLIAITFPDKNEYSIDKDAITLQKSNGDLIKCYKTRNSIYNLKEILDFLCERDFDDIEVHIIQCKTNWNDNAQIPMLWDAVYSATNFKSGISIGINGFSISDLRKFTYSFVTVPTVKGEIHPNSTCVLRVKDLSGGNYWGMASKVGVAYSIKEMLNRNLGSGCKTGQIRSLDTIFRHHTVQTNNSLLKDQYSYFQL